MPKVKVDGIVIEVENGTTVLQALRNSWKRNSKILLS
jgi:NADH dehydrogenase/NADH:ubiquinone oxidoreductase subunit G